MSSIEVLTLSAFFVTLLALGSANSAPRLFGGQEVDSLRQFPHHVYIIKSNGKKCGGSILNSRWIITSAACVKDSTRLEINFGKMTKFDDASPYHSISVNKDQVFAYPTNYDDLALVRLPVLLVFSDILAPVNISRLPLDSLRGRFSVMPGFEEDFPEPDAPAPTPPEYPPTAPSTTTPRSTTAYISTTPMLVKLNYGMFSILDNAECKQRLVGNVFNEYSQLCTESWSGSTNHACVSDAGSGLIIGWPAKNELVGIYHDHDNQCSFNQPAAFTYLAKYLPWIESMIHE